MAARKTELFTGELRSEAKARLLREGCWISFVKDRDRLRKEKDLTLTEAWAEAIKKYLPPPEIPEEGSAALVPVKEEEKKPPRQTKKKKHTAQRVPSFVFEGKQAPAHVAVGWVAKHLSITDVVAEDAPSSEAWGLLNWVRRQASNEQEFWKNIYPRLMPSRAQLDAAMRFTDDGRTQIELIDRVIASSVDAQRLAAMEGGNGHTSES